MLGITRETKRLIVVVIVAMAMLVAGTLLYLIVRPAPSCFDGEENQNEEGVDCGGVCAVACVVELKGEDLEVLEVAWVPDGASAGRFDALARVYNPNTTLGAETFSYTMTLRDVAGRELSSERGTAWILPRETKTILAFGLPAGTTPDKATLSITDVSWTKFDGYQEKPRLNILDRRYEAISSGVGFGQATGLLVNDSPFDFQSIMIKVILRDAEGKPLAVNQNEMRTVVVKEQRDFRLVWPRAFPGVVERVEMEADADVFHTDNFIKRYFPGGQFQEFAPSAR